MRKIFKNVVSIILVLALAVCVLPPFAISAAPAFTTEPMIATGAEHIVALNSDGTVWAWGSNMLGQLGNGTGGTEDWDEFSRTPVQVQNLTNVIAVDANFRSSAALRSDGTVWMWGQGRQGYNYTLPIQVPGFTNITAISMSSSHMLALRNDGTVWAWGSNNNGQIGDGTSSGWVNNERIDNDRQTAVQVPGLNNVVYISADFGASVAVLNDGTVWRWGRYDLDEDRFAIYTTSPVKAPGHSNVIAFATGGHYLSLRSDGTVWSGLDYPVQVQNISNATAISTRTIGFGGGVHIQTSSAVLRSDGTVWQWGDSVFTESEWDEEQEVWHFYRREQATAPSQVQGLYNIVAMAVNASLQEAIFSSYIAALGSDGTVWIMGTRPPGSPGGEWYQLTPTQIPGPNGVGILNLQTTPGQVPDTQTPPATPQDYVYVPNNHSSWAGPELRRAAEQNLIPATLQPAHVDLTQPITRAEFAGIVVMTFENLAHAVALPAIVNPFTDTHDPYVLRAFNTGLMVGISDTQFDPYTLLNREQAATALTRAFKRVTIPTWTFATDANYPLNFVWPALFADDANISGWARESVYFMAANGIILGTGNNMFSPRAATTQQQAIGYAIATREQALIIALRMVENLG